MANDSEYGLSAAVYSRDSAQSVERSATSCIPGFAISMAQRCMMRRKCRLAAAKASGYGRFGGRAGIAEFTELRWITIRPSPASFPSEAQRLLTMAGDKLRQPCGLFPRHRVSGMGHDADQDPLCLNEVAIRVRERPLSDDQHFLAAQLA